VAATKPHSQTLVLSKQMSWEDGPMTTLEAFVLGMMVAWGPSLFVIGWCLFRRAVERSSVDNDERISVARK